MGGSLMQRRRVRDEGLRVVNRRRHRTYIRNKSANFVPAAAVKRGRQTLSGFIGRKEFVGGFVS